MFRIDHPTAVGALPAPAVAGAPGYFNQAAPGSGQAPTVVSADFLNMLQEEVLAPVLFAGLTPDKTDHGQLLAAIQTIAVAAASAGFSAASAAEIWAAVSNVKAVTPLGLKNAMVGQILTPASTVSWDWNAGDHAELTLDANRLIGQPTNLQKNGTGSLQIKQPGVGGPWIPSFAACFDWRKIGIPTFSTGANKMDLLEMQVVDAVTPKIVITGLIAA